MLDPVQRRRLATAFEAMGAARVTLGLSASGHDWGTCFLAATARRDAPGKVRVLRRLGWTSHLELLSALIDAPLPALREVVKVWDRDERAFRSFATAWLEHARGAASAQATVEAARPAGRPAVRAASGGVRCRDLQGV